MSSFLIANGGIFCLLGALHAIFTGVGFLHLVNPDLITGMRSTGLRLSRNRTNMWDAWLGFNFSHAVGLILFGVICTQTAARSTMPLLVAVAGVYLLLALRFWFYAPAIAIAIATLCLLFAWLP